jgi:hypothetical protein
MIPYGYSKHGEGRLYVKEHELKVLKLLYRSRAENTIRTYKPK